MDKEIVALIDLAIKEDLGEGDHSALACVPKDIIGKAKLIAKDEGIVAGIEVGVFIFKSLDDQSKINIHKNDGDWVSPGDIILEIEGNEQLLLQAERLVLNFMQRMSGIATFTKRFNQELEGLKTKLLDTRKTTPGLRKIEKWAVRIGGGQNHRMGLYDMIMLKENHIDYAGGVEASITNAQKYLKANGKNIPIEIETRNLEELKEVLNVGGVQRIMLDNFSLNDLREAVSLINERFETEASGGINLETIRDIAKTGVDFVSVGALTHSVKSLDISMLVTV